MTIVRSSATSDDGRSSRWPRRPGRRPRAGLSRGDNGRAAVATVDAFLDAAGPFLVDREAEHNLILGISSNLQAGIRPSTTEPIDFLVVRATGRVVLAAVRTPPYNLVMSEVDQGDAVPALAEATGGRGPARGPGPDRSRRIVRRALVRRGRPDPDPPAPRADLPADGRPHARRTPTSGQLTIAGPDDRDLVIDWFRAFAAEALPAEYAAVPVELVDRRIALGGVYLWDDDGPVSLTVVGSRTPNGARVGPVYTPPDLRGRGYASACVAAASQAQLDAGRTFVFLFTDLANPTSNHIYQDIGYEPVRDIDSWRFEV